MTEEVVGGRGEGKRTFTSGGPGFGEWKIFGHARVHMHRLCVVVAGVGVLVGTRKTMVGWVSALKRLLNGFDV